MTTSLHHDPNFHALLPVFAYTAPKNPKDTDLKSTETHIEEIYNDVAELVNLAEVFKSMDPQSCDRIICMARLGIMSEAKRIFDKYNIEGSMYWHIGDRDVVIYIDLYMWDENNRNNGGK